MQIEKLHSRFIERGNRLIPVYQKIVRYKDIEDPERMKHNRNKGSEQQYLIS